VQQEVTDEVEDLYLRLVLTKSQGRINRAAQLAGLNPRGLYNKMRRLGLNKEDFKKNRLNTCPTGVTARQPVAPAFHSVASARPVSTIPAKNLSISSSSIETLVISSRRTSRPST